MSRIIAVLVALLAIVAVPARGGSATDPEIVDAAGDAHVLNSQGRPEAYGVFNPNGPDTRPASLDGADLRAIWFSTAYRTVVERAPDRTVRAVRYEVTGLKVHTQTTAPARPTFGPSLVFRTHLHINGCEFNTELFVTGPASTPADIGDRANVYALRGCPVGGTGYGAVAEFDGNVSVLTVPAYTLEGVITDGAVVRPFDSGARAHVRTHHVQPTLVAIDEAPLARPFTIGSDMPDDVDCLATPSEPVCSG